MEMDCDEELKKIKAEKKELQKEYKKSLAMLEKANKQAEDILKEKTKK
jgi:F0F1-type ATP synthase membrane subunit b/b'